MNRGLGPHTDPDVRPIRNGEDQEPRPTPPLRRWAWPRDGLVVSGLLVRASTACGTGPPGGMALEQAGFLATPLDGVHGDRAVVREPQAAVAPGFWSLPSRCVGRAWREWQHGQRSLTTCRPVPLRASLLWGRVDRPLASTGTGSQTVLPAAVSPCDSGASGQPEAPACRVRERPGLWSRGWGLAASEAPLGLRSGSLDGSIVLLN